MSACLLLVCIVMTAATALDAATPRRRSAPLDRLKRRSASARWDELRELWRFRSDNGDASPTDEDSIPTERDSLPVENDAESVVTDPVLVEPAEKTAWQTEPFLESDVAAPFTGHESSQPFGFRPSTTDVAVPRIGLPFQVSDSPSGKRPHIPNLPPLPDTFSEARTQLSLQRIQNSSDSSLQQTAATENLLPKPITAILPYYDYSPDGQDSCEFLCPPPEGCPVEAEAKPCPKSVELPDISLEGRAFMATHVMWEPSNLFHNPLYFEDHALERYGHTHCDILQPLVSAGKFGVQLIGLPYQMALHSPHERQYTLGWHRPGECVPYRYHLPPWNTKAAIIAGAAYTGLIFLIP